MFKRVTPLGSLALMLAAAAIAALLLALGFWILGFVVSATIAASTLPSATYYDTERSLDIIFDTSVYVALAGAVIFVLAALTFGLDRARHQFATAATTHRERKQPGTAPQPATSAPRPAPQTPEPPPEPLMEREVGGREREVGR